MNEWRLTTEIVRTGHVTGPESAERFDRWLAEVERAAAERAWDGACEAAKKVKPWSHIPANPYRKEQ